jgi:hypothetical protein
VGTFTALTACTEQTVHASFLLLQQVRLSLSLKTEPINPSLKQGVMMPAKPKSLEYLKFHKAINLEEFLHVQKRMLLKKTCLNKRRMIEIISGNESEVEIMDGIAAGMTYE